MIQGWSELHEQNFLLNIYINSNKTFEIVEKIIVMHNFTNLIININNK